MRVVGTLRVGPATAPSSGGQLPFGDPNSLADPSLQSNIFVNTLARSRGGTYVALVSTYRKEGRQLVTFPAEPFPDFFQLGTSSPPNRTIVTWSDVAGYGAQSRFRVAIPRMGANDRVAGFYLLTFEPAGVVTAAQLRYLSLEPFEYSTLEFTRQVNLATSVSANVLGATVGKRKESSSTPKSAIFSVRKRFL